MRQWWRSSDGSGNEINELRALANQLKQDNMRLRLDGQRPSSPGHLADDLRELSAELGARPLESADASDEALHVLAQAYTVRRAVVDVLVHLQVVAGQLERQIAGDVPSTEIDRRVRGLRGGGQDGRAVTELGESPAAQASTNGDAATPQVLAETSQVLAEMECLLGSDVPLAALGSGPGRSVG